MVSDTTKMGREIAKAPERSELLVQSLKGMTKHEAELSEFIANIFENAKVVQLGDIPKLSVEQKTEPCIRLYHKLLELLTDAILLKQDSVNAPGSRVVAVSEEMSIVFNVLSLFDAEEIQKKTPIIRNLRESIKICYSKAYEDIDSSTYKTEHNNLKTLLLKQNKEITEDTIIPAQVGGDTAVKGGRAGKRLRSTLDDPTTRKILSMYESVARAVDAVAAEKGFSASVLVDEKLREDPEIQAKLSGRRVPSDP